MKQISVRTFAGQRRQCKVLSIYDGDTITISTKLHWSEPVCRYRLRLAGIDTPELRGTNLRPIETEAGRYVRELLASKMPVGSTIIVEFQREDKYGRLCGVIWTTKRRFCFFSKPHRNINQWLTRNGLAMEYNGGTKKQFTVMQLQHILSRNKRNLK